MREILAACLVVAALAGAVGAAEFQAAGPWRFRSDDRADRPRTLLFSPMQPDYLRDTARHWQEVGFDGFIIHVGGWNTDIWSLGGEGAPRGADNPYLKQFRAANIITRSHGGGGNFPKIGYYDFFPDWFDDAAWAPIIEKARQFARFSRLAGSPGFAMDMEYIADQYKLDWKGYRYDGYAEADLRAAARRRGREMVGAMLEEHPKMELLILPEGPVYYGPLCAEMFAGFVEAMAEQKAPGGLHLLTEGTYTITDPLSLVTHPGQVRDIVAGQLSGAARDYWLRRGTIAPGAWPLGYYREILDAEGRLIGYGGKQETFGDKVVGSYADKSENYSVGRFRRQLAAMRMIALRYVWVYGHGATWWQLGEEQAARYRSVGNATLPTVKNLREYEAVVASREIISDPGLTPGAERLRRGEPADLGGPWGIIADWQLIGPFPDVDHTGPRTAFGPEAGIDLAATYEGLEGPVRWFAHHSDDPLRAVNLRRVFDRSDEATAYGLLWVTSPRDLTAQLRLGSNDDGVVWWDGEEIHRVEGGRGLTPDQDILPLRITAGTHTLLVKVCNWGANWGFIVRFTDAAGRPLKGLRYTIWPPPE